MYFRTATKAASIKPDNLPFAHSPAAVKSPQTERYTQVIQIAMEMFSGM
jgi:hypothetical protein